MQLIWKFNENSFLRWYLLLKRLCNATNKEIPSQHLLTNISSVKRTLNAITEEVHWQYLYTNMFCVRQRYNATNTQVH